MGLKLVLPDVTFSNLSLPVLRDDPVLPDAGALLLLDPTHPLSPWAAGVPATVPNLVAGMAAELAGTAAAGMASAAVVSTFGSASEGYFERTGKGGLHGIVSQTGDVAGKYGRIDLPTGVGDYLHANPTHDYYVSSWGKITRNGSTATSTVYYFLHGLAVTTAAWNLGIQSRSTGNLSAQPSTNRIGLNATKETDGRYIITSAVSDRNAAITTKPTVVSRFGPYTGTDLHGAPSHVLYRLYVEDLTASGRTWDQVNALDVAEYTKHVKTAGGRYYADTHAAPSI